MMLLAAPVCARSWYLAALLIAGEDPGRVAPGRPNVSSSTNTIAARALQLEVGVDHQIRGLARGEEVRLAVPAIIRIGVHQRIELRLFGADPWRWLHGRTGARAQSDIAVGIKARLLERDGPAHVSLGVRAELLPLDPFRRSARFWAPLPAAVLILTLAPAAWSIDLNLGARMNATESGRCCGVTSVATLSVARSFADRRLQLWGEAYARFDPLRGAPTEVAGDGGLQIWAGRRLAFDVGALVGSAQRTLLVAALAGLAVRWGP